MRPRRWPAPKALFTEDDSIVVPRVYPELSTRRMLTMEFLEGSICMNSSRGSHRQEERDHFGRLIFRATARLHYGGKLLYADPSPGNFLFLPDGRLGFIDFGCVRPYNDAEWDLCRLADLDIQDGPDSPIRSIREFAALAAGRGRARRAPGAPQILVSLDVATCTGMPGPFDFGDDAYLREGVDIHDSLLQRAIQPGRPDVPSSPPAGFSAWSRCSIASARGSTSVRSTGRSDRRRDGATARLLEPESP